jgi:hypothetical protein
MRERNEREREREREGKERERERERGRRERERELMFQVFLLTAYSFGNQSNPASTRTQSLKKNISLPGGGGSCL